MDPKEFEELSPEEQAKVFHHSPFKERGELLLYSNDPRALIRSLSQEEFYLVTKQMDIEEKGEVIKHANLDQLFFLADIDCWKKDRIEPAYFLTWLETLEKAEDAKLLAWLVEADYETVVSGLKKIIQVLKPDHEYAMDEILGDAPYFTLDRSYFISVEEQNLETVRRAFEILFENHRGRYAALLEGVMAELDDELEEEAYRRREMRLAERGFADFETAHQIFRLISKEEYEKFPKKEPRATDRSFKMPSYPAIWSHSRFFLDDAFTALREEPLILEGLQEELAMLSNKVIACDGIDFSSEEKVRKGIERARAFANIGLEALSGGEVPRACQILRERWLEIIFRWGVTQALHMKEKALEIIRKEWGGSQESFIRFLNPPYEFIFRGLLRPLPEYYDSEVRDQMEPLRDFRSLQDLQRTQPAVEQIAEVMNALNHLFPDLSKRLHLTEDDPELEISLFNLLGTVFASFVIKQRPSLAPIHKQEIQLFLQTAFENRSGRRWIRPELKDSFIQVYFPELKQDQVKAFWALLFEGLEEEFSRLNPAAVLESGYISLIRTGEEVQTAKKAPLKKNSRWKKK